MGRQLTPGLDSWGALRVDGVSKSYAGTNALGDVSFAVASGAVHALIGGNGSGKSTLLRILAGVTIADAGGRLTVQGSEIPVTSASPQWAHRAGLRFVHQELGLFPDLSVTENLALGAGFATRGGVRIDWRTMRRHAAETLLRFDIDAAPSTTVRTLDLPTRSMLAIARAFQDESANPRLFVLDEATAALSAPQREHVWHLIDEHTARGHAVLIVAHQLGEVLRADAATILRDGRVVATVEPASVDRAELEELVVGRPVSAPPRRRPPPTGPERLTVDHLTGRTARGVSFALRSGEVLGLAGPHEGGQQEVLELLFGAARIRAGSATYDGVEHRPNDIGDAMRRGFAYVPGDRADATFPRLTLTENLTVASLDVYWRALWLHRGDEARDTRSTIAARAIRASSPHQDMATLSGGNQQKVVLERWLRRDPRVMLLDQPTRGVDLDGRRALQAMITTAAAQGCVTIVVSDDFEELAEMCDRVLVMVAGEVVADLRAPDLDAGRIAEAAFGPPPAA